MELKLSDKVAVEATGNSHYFCDKVINYVEEVVVVAPGQFEVIRRSSVRQIKIIFEHWHFS